MSRIRESLGTRVFSIIMCLILVAGLIPTQALAEAASEASAGIRVAAETSSKGGAKGEAAGTADVAAAKDQPAEAGQLAEQDQSAEISPIPEGQLSDVGRLSGETQSSGENRPVDEGQPLEESDGNNKTSDSTKPSSDGGDGGEAAANDVADPKSSAADELPNADELPAADELPVATSPAAKTPDTKGPTDTPAFKAEQVVDGVKVAVKAEAGVFPAGARLSVQKATNVQELQAGEAVQAVRDEGKNVAESHTFDIKVLDADGKEVQPTQSRKVKVSFSLPEVADKNLQTQVYHVSADETSGRPAAESLNVSTQETPETGKQTTAVVETTGFSLYTVEFTYNSLQYVMPGDTQVPLSWILAAVGLAGEVSAAEVSNPELFSASNETGEWVLTARQAFETTEWLKVTINDVTYEVAVTDSETQTVSYVERHWDETRKKVVAESKTHEAKPFPRNSTTIPSGWYVAEGRVEVNSRVSITGDTHLILSNKADGLFPGCSVILGGIYVPRGCTLHIYGQDLGSGDSGTLYAGSGNGAGIGGYPGHEGGDVVVHGGRVQAQGSEYCAGIGGSDGQDYSGSLTVYGGRVFSIGGNGGAGIGGGRGGDGGDITIYGGDVIPCGGKNAAGLGGGNGGNGGDITVDGGTIRVPDTNSATGAGGGPNGGDNGAGIGGGRGGNAGTITINGGNVNVAGGNNGAGIGCGGDAKGNSGGSVTVNGGTVKATGGDDGAGIGGGENGWCEVVINGGSVTANGGCQAAAIGGGHNYDAGTIAIRGGKVVANANSNKGKGIGGGHDSDCSTPIVLGYTDSTKNGISITTPSYDGAVTLEQGFTNHEGRYEAGSTPDRSKLASSTLKAWDANLETWGQLRERILAAEDGATIKLEQDYEAVDADMFLNAPGGHLTIDLNGHTLNRNLQSSRRDGEVIFVGQTANLTIEDSAGGGVIKGGYSENGAGGINCLGTLTINGGTITENRATTNGGGIYVWDGDSNLHLNGGTITGNTCGDNGNGGGVYVDGAMSVSGNPVVTGNKKGEDKNNIWLKNDATISVVGALTKGASLSVIQDNYGGVITSGYAANNTTDGTTTPPGTYFTADKEEYAPTIESDEVKFATEDTEIARNVRYIQCSWNADVADDTNATLHLNGGIITENACANATTTTGGGVHVSGTATMTVSGDPVVAGNKKGFTSPRIEDNNVSLAGGAKIKVTGVLDERANIGVNLFSGFGASPTGTFTSQYGKYNQALPSTYFHSDSKTYSVVTASDNGYTEGRIDAGVVGVTYLSYEWTDDKLVESLDSTDGNWMTYPGGRSIPGGMYVLNRNITENGRVTLQDNTWLVLCDGCTLDVKGLYIPQGKTLTVYGQAEGTGKIYSHPSTGAGIGATNDDRPGGNVVIHGGTIEATGADHCAGIGSNDGDNSNVGDFTMYHGTVIATGGEQGAGIGGGRDCDGGTITIYGGTVNATGQDSSAGIGGSDAKGSRRDTSTINIYGGNITATGDDKGAGIGGGEYGNANINISGGKIIATGGPSGGAGIGSGVDGNASTVSITGGNINAACYSSGYGIGNGKNTSGSTIILDYTEATKDISVTAASFGGVVTLNKYFRMNDKDRILDPGVVNNNSMLVGGALTSWLVYTVTVQEAVHGFATASSAMAQAGTPITVSAMPNEGYVTDAIKVVDSNGDVVPVSDGVFTMPASPVIVVASFQKASHTLTFFEDTAGTKVWRTEQIENGTPLSTYANYGSQDPNLLQKDGYTFAGWATEPNIVVDSYKTKDGKLNPALEGKLVNFDEPMYEDVDAYPIWIRDRLNVTIDFGAPDVDIDGTQQTNFTVNIDEKIAMRCLIGATRTGYDLAGWYTEGGVLWNGADWRTLEYATEGWTETAGWGMTPEYCNKDADGKPIKQVDEECKFNYYTVTLTARWTPLDVIVKYTGSEPDSGSVTERMTHLGDTFTLFDRWEDVEGKTFMGWRVGNRDTIYSPGGAFTFDDWSLVGDDNSITFVAQYINTSQGVVMFDSAGGTVVGPVSVYVGSTISPEPETTKVGHTFLGWYDEDVSTTERVQFPYDITGSTTLTAHWQVNRYTITFDTAGGSGIDPITEDYGTVLYEPDNPPTKDHYEFAGWVPSVPDAMPAENITIKATWTPKRYQIEFDAGEGSSVPAIEDVYGAPIVAPEDPTWEGHVFVGWTDGSGNVVALPSYMPDNEPPLKFTAKWKTLQAAPQVEAEVLDARSAKVKNPVAGAEYVIVPAGQAPGAKDWTNAKRLVSEGGDVVFEGLSPATSYDVWARMFETDEAAKSEAAMATVTTPKERQDAPGSAPNAWAVNPTTVAAMQGSGAQEFALVPKGSPVPAADSDEWKSPGGDGRAEWSGLEPDTEYDAYARMKGGDTKDPSGPSPAATVKTPPVIVTSVILNSENAKKIYYMGEALDVTGLTLGVSKSDGSKQTVDVTADMVSGFDGSKISEQTLSVTYEGFTRTYDIVVTKSFPDVPEDDWFYGVVSRAVGLGLFNGYENGNFGPSDKVTRGQAVVVLWNMTGHPEPDAGAKQFGDVKAGMYYADAISWATQVGVVSGYGDGTFGPNHPITREQFAAMICNYARMVAGKETTGSAGDYEEMKDAGKVSKWAESSVGWCFKNDIISGTEDGYVNPQDNTTRAEAAKMLVYLHDVLRP